MESDPLKMNLLYEWTTRYERKREESLAEKIHGLYHEIKGDKLSPEETEVLEEVMARFQKAEALLDQEEDRNPLQKMREQALERVFLKFRGLVFDLKTRLDYSSAEVAIQDGLDLSEYVREVIEEINNDLNESYDFENPALSEFQQGLSQFYGSFQRDRLKELYPESVELLKLLREAVKK